eukprot:CCRYP_012638-RA/>CCRYP_012638-RA protein AED:0.44 eAED:0.44 QI:0/-1/0/1/-1/1/1/0/277
MLRRKLEGFYTTSNHWNNTQVQLRTVSGGANNFQQFQPQASRSVQSNSCFSQTSLGESNSVSDKNRNFVDNHCRFNDTNQSQESCPRSEVGNINVATPSYSSAERTHHFSSASAGQKGGNLDNQGIAHRSHTAGGIRSHYYNVDKSLASQVHPWNDRKQWNVSTAVTMSGASNSSSGNEIPQIRTCSASSQIDSNDVKRGLPLSNADRTSTQQNYSSMAAGPNDTNEARAQATASIIQNVPMAQHSIALLSNPPNDPMLEEFANEFLAHFGRKDVDG